MRQVTLIAPRVSYQPLAEVFRTILPRETRHTELGLAGLVRIADDEAGSAKAKASVAYWYPRVAESFGHSGSARFETLSRFGLRHTPNETLLAEWQAEVDPQLSALNLN